MGKLPRLILDPTPRLDLGVGFRGRRGVSRTLTGMLGRPGFLIARLSDERTSERDEKPYDFALEIGGFFEPEVLPIRDGRAGYSVARGADIPVWPGA